ncbi:MAG TPA: ATP-binding protein [Terriglobales bacterium]
MPIRMRLTLWYFLIVAASLIGFALFALAVMRQSIYTTVDEQLRDRAVAVQVLVSRTGSEDIVDAVREHAELQSGSQLLQMSDGFGKFLYRSSLMERLGVPASRADQLRIESAEYNELPLRVLSTTITAGGQQFLLQIAEPMDDYLEALEGFRSALFVGIPVLLIFAALGGYWMSTRALRPVDRITEAARMINPQDLSQRVTVPKTGDELQRMAETLNQMLQRIESAVARITQFTADASHELRTPIALIRTRAEVTLAKPRTTEQYREALKEVQAESERTTALIENLMTLARADTGSETLNFDRTNIGEVASEVSNQAQTLTDTKQLQWSATIPDAPIWVRGDANALRRLLLILIDNAVKYTPPSGSVNLAVQRNSTHAEIRVCDTGIGISESDLPHIFERFYRADKARSRELGGTGLGLSIGRWIAHAHGGEIRLESSNGGCAFLVLLPIIS